MPEQSIRNVRGFLAIDVGETVRARIAEAQQTLRDRNELSARWAPPANIHLTLAFLGCVAPELLDVLAEKLRAELPGTGAFSFDVVRLGFFGRPRRPRTIWAGIPAPSGPLMQLHARVTAIVRNAGIDIEKRPFTPHLTVARPRPSNRKPDLPALLSPFLNTTFGTVNVRSILLMKSELRRTGAVHEVLHEIDLVCEKVKEDKP